MCVCAKQGVGDRGRYKLPGQLQLSFPTTRPPAELHISRPDVSAHKWAPQLHRYQWPPYLLTNQVTSPQAECDGGKGYENLISSTGSACDVVLWSTKERFCSRTIWWWNPRGHSISWPHGYLIPWCSFGIDVKSLRGICVISKETEKIKDCEEWRCEWSYVWHTLCAPLRGIYCLKRVGSWPCILHAKSSTQSIPWGIDYKILTLWIRSPF